MRVATWYLIIRHPILYWRMYKQQIAPQQKALKMYNAKLRIDNIYRDIGDGKMKCLVGMYPLKK